MRGVGSAGTKRRRCVVWAFLRNRCYELWFFRLVIQLRFVLQVFWKWYVLSHAARGLLSSPTWVGCCFYSCLLENE